jgi:UDP-GlcNAc:undecaprenyl-phosphate GlcNAc-1-phosphate transferase
MSFWLISAALSCLLCGLALPILRRAGIVDRPNARSSHREPTVRGGGVGIVAACLGCAVLLLPDADVPRLLPVLAGVAVLAVVSFRDDIRPVSVGLRLGIHLAVAIVAIAMLPATHGPVWLWWILGVLWLVGSTNSFNFMDGINGIAGAQALIAGGGTALIAAAAGLPGVALWGGLAWLASGSAAGFLPYNFPRARLFMGDVGSASLGFLLGYVALGAVATGGVVLLPPLLCLHLNFVLDTTITLVRRVAAGERPGVPHRDHFYQRLTRAGWSHVAVTGCEAGLQLVSAGIALASVAWDWAGQVAALATVGFLWLLFFALAEWIFRRSDRIRRKGDQPAPASRP